MHIFQGPLSVACIRSGPRAPYLVVSVHWFFQHFYHRRSRMVNKRKQPQVKKGAEVGAKNSTTISNTAISNYNFWGQRVGESLPPFSCSRIWGQRLGQKPVLPSVMEPYIIIIFRGRGWGSGGISKKGEMGAEAWIYFCHQWLLVSVGQLITSSRILSKPVKPLKLVKYRKPD